MFAGERDSGFDPTDDLCQKAVMTYVHDAAENMGPARLLLDRLWDEAREIAVLKRQLGRGASFPGGVSWLRPENVSGAHLYEEDGGWRCDLTLEGIPEGRPDCVGAPDPLPDRHAASTFALAILCDVVIAHPEPGTEPRLPRATQFPPPPSAPPETPTFVYDGVDHPLPGRVARELREAGIDRISEGYVRRRLDEVRRDLAGGGPMTLDVVSRLGNDARRAFLTVCTMASLKGIARWPEGGA